MSLLSEIVVPGGGDEQKSEIAIRTNRVRIGNLILTILTMTGEDGGGVQSKSVTRALIPRLSMLTNLLGIILSPYHFPDHLLFFGP